MSVSVRVHEGRGPNLVYLPGIHGDWGLIGAFRRALGDRVRFVEFAYSKDDVTLEHLAELVHAELEKAGVRSGWLLGQSFGSQVAWALIARGFKADGVVLAGGFAKHPWPWGARLFRALLSAVPYGVINPVYKGYTVLCNAVARRGPEEAEELMAFARARGGRDWKATTWRLKLIAEGDPGPVVRGFAAPVHYLGGGIDPLVPWPLVVRGLRRDCPGYKGEVILPYADHNVLGSSPASPPSASSPGSPADPRFLEEGFAQNSAQNLPLKNRGGSEPEGA
ncbi:MAG: alpha/beta hydrolase [Elusimicrobiota bacterium]|nr:MAG: alpha/beta hydrolase [Elusimicrobiota bacterium]